MHWTDLIRHSVHRRQRRDTTAEEPAESAGVSVEPPSPEPPPRGAVIQAAEAAHETELLLASHLDDPDLAASRPGSPFDRHSPFLIGLVGALGLAAGYGIVLAFLQLSEVFTYLVVAMFIALGLEPIVDRLVRLGLRRGSAVTATLGGVTLVLALLSWLIVPTIVEQVTQLVQHGPGYVDDIRQSHLLRELDQRWHVSDRLTGNVQKSVNQTTLTTVFGGVLGAGKAFADGVTAVFAIVVLTIYFVAAMPRVKVAVYKVVPRSRRSRVVHLSEAITTRVGGYILGQVCVALINAVLSYIILIVLGLPFPLVLAAIVGLLALVPIVGTLVGAVLMTLVALTSGWVPAVIVLGYYIAYHLLETYIIAPRIMRRIVHVPPVVTIVAVLAGATLFGILGALLAIPVAAGLLLIYDEVAVPRQQRS